MIGINAMAEVAALMGDPARANMLYALVEDGCLSASELAAVAAVAPSTASEHLAKLVQSGMVAMSAKGRKRYFSLADPAVAEVMKGVEGLAESLSRKRPGPLPWDQATIHARCCLDHLAGRLGAQVAGAVMAKGFIAHSPRGPYLSEAGAAWMATLGADPRPLEAEPRRFLRLCTDWVEDSSHLGGALGAELLKGFLRRDWLRRPQGSRIVKVTPLGAAAFRDQLDLDVRYLEEEH
jgi:DNA-binding transcriptional ArsR family regulator